MASREKCPAEPLNGLEEPGWAGLPVHLYIHIIKKGRREGRKKRVSGPPSLASDEFSIGIIHLMAHTSCA